MTLGFEVSEALSELIEDSSFALQATDDETIFTYGKHVIQCGVDEDRSQYSVWSLCLLDIECNDFALETISRWTAFKLARVVIVNGHIVVEVVLPGESFSASQLARALVEVVATLDQIDSEIAENAVFTLGGRRFN
ncbi:MAG: hypothetical protein RIS75_201 [Actinomycetota bacterium]